MAPTVALVVYQRPLGYLLGLEGAALLRAFISDHDPAFTEQRIAEIRRLLLAPGLDVEGVDAERVTTAEGYAAWSAGYDDPGNGLFAIDEPLVRQILGPLPPGLALDAACGTGRLSAALAVMGHRVVGVDSSPDMLARARRRVPQALFLQGDLHRLPLDDACVDIAVCALALTHLPDLHAPVAELARVLRPDGHLVIVDVHHELLSLGSVPRIRLPDGRPGMLPGYRHRASDYLDAALPVGLEVRRCVEPGKEGHGDGEPPTDEADVGADPGPWDAWPWSLMGIVPAAAKAVRAGTPSLMVWHFQRRS